jgi:hypothetical protein
VGRTGASLFIDAFHGAVTHRMLTLRPTRIAGETAPDDWSVLCDGRVIGRMMRQIVGAQSSTPWGWSITVPLPTIPGSQGGAESLEGAKAAFRIAWAKYREHYGGEALRRAPAA